MLYSRGIVMATLWAMLAISLGASSSEKGFHVMPDGSLMRDTEMIANPIVDLEEERDIPVGYHTMADGTVMRDEDMLMSTSTLDMSVDNGLRPGHHIMADGTIMQDGAESIENDLMLGLRTNHKWGFMKKVSKTVATHAKKVVQTVKTAVKKTVTKVKNHVVKWVMSKLPDKEKVAGLPSKGLPVKQTWTSWKEVIQAAYLSSIIYMPEATFAALLKGCASGLPSAAVKHWGTTITKKLCSFFAAHGPFKLRTFLDHHDFKGKKHQGLEATVLTVNAAEDFFDLLEVDTIPERIITEANKEARAAQSSALKAAMYASKAKTLAAAAAAKPKSTKPKSTKPKSTKPKSTKPAAKPKSTKPSLKKKSSGSGTVWVAFRGSSAIKDWVTNFKGWTAPWPYGNKVGKTHQGFLDQYAQARGVIKQTVLNLIKQGYRKVFITGHSLGGALAELAAMDASEYTKGLGVTVEMTSFGAPYTADDSWVKNYDKMVPLSTRIVYDADVVACLPGGLKHVAMLSALMGKFKGGLKATHIRTQVSTRLMFARGRWFHQRWPKCNVYRQGVEDHSIQNKYLVAVEGQQPVVKK
jgi:hypothetical protein